MKLIALSFYIRKALEQFLEDREDYFLAVARLEENNPRIPLEEALNQLEEKRKKEPKDVAKKEIATNNMPIKWNIEFDKKALDEISALDKPVRELLPLFCVKSSLIWKSSIDR